MTTSEERIAKALESLVIIVDDILAQMVMEKQDDSVARAQAQLNNRPGAMKFLQNWSGRVHPVSMSIINVHVSNGEIKFAGLIDNDFAPGKQIEGIIKDVY
jgi:hypothetical protein